MGGILSDNATPGTGNYYDQTGDADGRGNIKRFGDEIVLIDSVAIRDQANYDYTMDPTGREVTIVINNGLDQALDVDIFMQPVATVTHNSTIYSVNTDIAIAGTETYSPYAGGTGAAGHTAIPALRGPCYRLTVRVSCATAGVNPTSGDVDIYAYVS